jgi:hypothetical protein
MWFEIPDGIDIQCGTCPKYPLQTSDCPRKARWYKCSGSTLGYCPVPAEKHWDFYCDACHVFHVLKEMRTWHST